MKKCRLKLLRDGVEIEEDLQALKPPSTTMKGTGAKAEAEGESDIEDEKRERGKGSISQQCSGSLNTLNK